MLHRTRSQTQALQKLIASTKPKSAQRVSHIKPSLIGKLCKATEAEQIKEASRMFHEKYNYPARTLQVCTAVRLFHEKIVFLIAGTGYGKSRIPELFANFHTSGIVLMICPLDALGDDQVLEKALVDEKAVNLTSRTITKELTNEILIGKFRYVYVSPEIALTNRLFEQLWQNPAFQAQLILKVVDEAHMIYTWGLVESGKAKTSISHLKVQDKGAFRPHYGKLARRFLATDDVPLLLMSATCRPQAVDAILDNLKYKRGDVKFYDGELVRPEIRLLRRTFKRPLNASLRGLFAPETLVPTSSIPPSLIYAGTQNATLEFVRIISNSRGRLDLASNGLNTFARQYHASTGESDKKETVKAFVQNNLAVICCTLALGLGQNWHRVRRVAVLGRQEPGNVIQMIGRCGRDRRRGLGLMLVESNRTRGKNKISDFHNQQAMSDDDRMDALAITPVCLRVALAVDLKHGWIPLKETDPEVQMEVTRQRAKGMAECDCSNCLPEEAEALWLLQPHITNDNMEEVLKMNLSELKKMLAEAPAIPNPNEGKTNWIPKCVEKDDSILEDPAALHLVEELKKSFSSLFDHHFAKNGDLTAENLFPEGLAWEITKNVGHSNEKNFLKYILGSETLKDQFKVLMDCISIWKNNNLESSLLNHSEPKVRHSKPKPWVPRTVEGAKMEQDRLKIAQAEKKEHEATMKKVKAAQKEHEATLKKEKAAQKKQEKMEKARLRIAQAEEKQREATLKKEKAAQKKKEKDEARAKKDQAKEAARVNGLKKRTRHINHKDDRTNKKHKASS